MFVIRFRLSKGTMNQCCGCDQNLGLGCWIFRIGCSPESRMVGLAGEQFDKIFELIFSEVMHCKEVNEKVNMNRRKEVESWLHLVYWIQLCITNSNNRMLTLIFLASDTFCSHQRLLRYHKIWVDTGSCSRTRN